MQDGDTLIEQPLTVFMKQCMWLTYITRAITFTLIITLMYILVIKAIVAVTFFYCCLSPKVPPFPNFGSAPEVFDGLAVLYHCTNGTQ